MHETSRRHEMVQDPRRDAETFWAETERRPETHVRDLRHWAFYQGRDVTTSREGRDQDVKTKTGW